MGLTSVFISSLGLAGAQSLQPTWELPSDGSWQPETVSLGADGVEVFSEYGFYQNAKVLLSAHDSNPPTPVWSDAENLWNHVRRVDSSDQGQVHAALHQEYSDSTMTYRQPVLRKYSSGSANADWIYTSDILMTSEDACFVFVSDDGARIVTAIYDSYRSATVVTVFDSHSSQPQMEHEVNTGGAFEGLAMSGDGRRLVLRASLKLQVVDIDSGSELFSKYYFSSPFAGGLDISGDGSVIAMASGSSLDVFTWNGATYAGPSSVSLPGGSYTPAVAVSDDGSTVAHASNFYTSPADVHLRVFDASTTNLSTDYMVTGSGSAPNVASALQLSNDGGVAALGLWGDSNGTVPEVLLFNRDHVGIAASCDLPGSIIDLDLSPDGERVAVAAKGCHETQFGSGGGLYLFETCQADFDLHGVPSVGNLVTLGHELSPGDFGRVIASPMLSGDPRVFAGVGTLYLDEAQLSFLPGVSMAGGDGMVWTPHVIPNDSALVGTTMYFQGLGLRPRQLSEDIVRMTVLP